MISFTSCRALPFLLNSPFEDGIGTAAPMSVQVKHNFID